MLQAPLGEHGQYQHITQKGGYLNVHIFRTRMWHPACTEQCGLALLLLEYLVISHSKIALLILLVQYKKRKLNVMEEVSIEKNFLCHKEDAVCLYMYVYVCMCVDTHLYPFQHPPYKLPLHKEYDVFILLFFPTAIPQLRTWTKTTR